MLRRCCACRGLLSRASNPRQQLLSPLLLQPWNLPTATLTRHARRPYSSNKPKELSPDELSSEFKDLLFFPTMSPRERWKPGETEVVVYGFIGKIRKVSKDLAFANLELNNGEYQGQICAKGADLADALRKIQPYSAVLAVGAMTDSSSPARFDMEISSIRYLNPFPKDIIVSSDAVFPAEARHLQLRFHDKLKEALRFRAFLKSSLSETMNGLGYLDVETPTLFKSTSEGAREFLVPTRRAGYAYALPQSPQQYKQVLMASGLGGYYQFARCYRDEDHRADRQPEFTQMDLERSFATGETIMGDVEKVVQRAWDAMRGEYVLRDDGTSFTPVKRTAQQSLDDNSSTPATSDKVSEYPRISTPFPRMTYEDCMTLYGSDKPDLRIPNTILRVDENLSPDFVGMISHLESPIVEAWKLSLHEDVDRGEAQNFLRGFMETLHKSFHQNPDGAPQALAYDSSKPLQGFSALGPDGLRALQEAATPSSGLSDLQDGDMVVFQARRNRPHQGGWTKLGEFRVALYQAAVEAGLVERDDARFRFLWVTDFPMFTPDEEVDVGQGGSAGFSATHHPFTAPLGPEDVDLLFADPLRARADHYDLVLNGVELGGGSRRIHVAKMQEYVLRDILGLGDTKMAEFSHLLKALRAGCPPHAGFALGFDRFVAVLSGASSVRDVIAFPKNNKGVDEFAGGPGRISNEALETYHLQFKRRK
ncbi:aspartyl-tRNA synthetase [Sodiomyces alkalinus F11]|uniref:Aspartyl-tRNA synthetase n=1 Tax=Sodiomyces alkalinus (strain CBS 110278 / VKM F-3762 / F11) TaxID=1314773 RepID=A0A3N2QAB0_SODAK|nr:aspartyl-tRNA synthetase [Sodiomyces alkalinus F11]ROT43657.1 aspartyl-tRNA synthetase [Sodiomyces alkalinus F11]